jgi:hypothetical protein
LCRRSKREGLVPRGADEASWNSQLAKVDVEERRARAPSHRMDLWTARQPFDELA